MTPLAHQLMKRVIVGRSRDYYDPDNILWSSLHGSHFFECTEIKELCYEMTRRAYDGMKIDDTLLFLPADKTWIEFYDNVGTPTRRARFSFVLESIGESEMFASFVTDVSAYKIGVIQMGGGSVPVGIGQKQQGFRCALWNGDVPKNVVEDAGRLLLKFIPGALAAINTPKVIGRQEYAAHRTLEKLARAQEDKIGKFPLRGWTEIKLHVTPPDGFSGELGGESHFIGRKALHFCRSHLRIANGRLVLVRGHWRGDASLGIKQSRYTIKP